MTIKAFFTRAIQVVREKGLYYSLVLGLRLMVKDISNYFGCYIIYKPFGLLRTFELDGTQYNYFYHTYNSAWSNERTVEIPIALHILKKYRNQNVLEVGNVLSHYISVKHDIVDKYERARGVINQDIVDFRPAGKKYDLIVSISTLEHIGWNERPRDPTKVPRAIDHLRTLLAPQGMLFVTLPLGYNKYLDTLLKGNKIPFTKVSYLKKMSRNSVWAECSWKDVQGAKYGEPFVSANGLVVGYIKNE